MNSFVSGFMYFSSLVLRWHVGFLLRVKVNQKLTGLFFFCQGQAASQDGGVLQDHIWRRPAHRSTGEISGKTDLQSDLTWIFKILFEHICTVWHFDIWCCFKVFLKKIMSLCIKKINNTHIFLLCSHGGNHIKNHQIWSNSLWYADHDFWWFGTKT